MRRFSQRNQLVTLNEINITPLLDLAFVLLIIFVITRPLLEQSIDLNLPEGGVASGAIAAQDVKTVEISVRGEYKLNGTRMPLPNIIAHMEAAHKANPKTIISIRADESSANKYVYAVIDNCLKRGLTTFSLRTQPDK